MSSLDRIGGLDGDLGQGGVKVARSSARGKKPKLSFFDSTSVVDTATDAKIRAGLLLELVDRQKIIIAHVNSVMDSDQIVVLDNGRVRGDWHSHRTSRQEPPIYRELYESQIHGSQSDIDAAGKGGVTWQSQEEHVLRTSDTTIRVFVS